MNDPRKMSRDEKEHAVGLRIREIAPHTDVLLPVMDEWQLDLLLLAFGLGEVTKTSRGL